MNIKKEVLNQLKRTDKYFENENMTAVRSIVDNCIVTLEKSIKEDNERECNYVDDLVKELK